MAEALAAQAAVAIKNAQLFEQVRESRQRLQMISRALVEVQETERRRLAHELHDEIGQILTGLKLSLELAARLPPDAVSRHLQAARGLVEELITRVHDLSLDLRPPMLDDLGLVPALLWHFERFTNQTQVTVRLEHTGLERRFPPEVETAAYRIVQEALTNVARHAGTHEATVRLWADAETLHVEIEDRGRGLDLSAVRSQPSGGLSGMRERAAFLGGCLTLESSPGGGTRLTAEIPLSGTTERRKSDRCP